MAANRRSQAAYFGLLPRYKAEEVERIREGTIHMTNQEVIEFLQRKISKDPYSAEEYHRQ